MVDIHCHILPGIDDGPSSWELTAEMCHIATLDGITHIVATPHCNDKFATIASATPTCWATQRRG